MTEILTIIAMLLIIGALGIRVLEDRRERHFEEHKRRARDWKHEVERQARKQL